MTLFKSVQNRWILFLRDLGAVLNRHLVVDKTKADKKQQSVNEKKILVKNLERAKRSHSEQRGN